jgi:hypothetical protein
MGEFHVAIVEIMNINSSLVRLFIEQGAAVKGQPVVVCLNAVTECIMLNEVFWVVEVALAGTNEGTIDIHWKSEIAQQYTA